MQIVHFVENVTIFSLSIMAADKYFPFSFGHVTVPVQM